MRIPVMALVWFAVAACGAVTTQAGPNGFDGKRAFEDVRQLVAIGPRVAGTPGAAGARGIDRAGTAGHRWTLRHQAVREVHVRRRERWRLECRVPHRARPGSQG